MHRLPLGVLLAGALLAACGGDDGGSSPQQQASDAGETVEEPGGVELGPADEGVEGVVVLRIEPPPPGSNGHTQAPIDYERLPPAGGWHNPIWLNCGFYDDPQPTEAAVHSLEHGAVWLAYSPDLGAAALDAVRALVAANPKVLATPVDDLPDDAGVVATAWARQLAVETATDPRLAQFIDTYVDAGPSPEAGSSCEGAFGEPEEP